MQKIYGFLDNLIWIGNGNFSLLLREYSQLAVNVLIAYSSNSAARKLYWLQNNWYWLFVTTIVHDEKKEIRHSILL